MKELAIGLIFGLIILVLVFLGFYGLAWYFSWEILGSTFLTAIVLGLGGWILLEVLLRNFGSPPHLVKFTDIRNLENYADCYHEARVYCRGENKDNATHLAWRILVPTAQEMSIEFDRDCKVQNVLWVTYLTHKTVTIIDCY